MKRIALILVFSIPVVILSLLILRKGERENQFMPELTKDIFALGEATYGRQCSVCHGPSGKGDGPASYLLYPKPRDFTRGEFRLISTTTMVPTNSDLFDTISSGMPGSAMPAWDFLPSRARWALVFYVRYLTNSAKDREGAANHNFEEKKKLAREEGAPADLISVPSEPPVTAQGLEQGKLTFRSACASCHGSGGKGDGPQKMVDSSGFPIRPRDLTSGTFKGGGSSRALYLRVSAGLPGSPMPAYREALSSEQIWNLAHYVQSLSKEDLLRGKLFQQAFSARKIEGEIPADPFASFWQDGEATVINLVPLWWRDHATEKVFVKSVHNGKSVAFYLKCKDASEDASLARHKSFSDGAALQFSSDEDPPFFGMGSAEQPVYFWHWKASWQQELNAKSPIASHDPLFMSAWGAKNPISQPQRKSALEEAAARGFGTLTSTVKLDPRGKAEGVWKEGFWHLIFEGDMSHREGVTFKPGQTFSIAFAIWDGSERDRNGQKNVSIWNKLVLER